MSLRRSVISHVWSQRHGQFLRWGAAQAAQRAASRPSPWSTGYARFWQQNAILERARGGDYFRTTAEQHRVLNDAVLAATQAVCSAAILNLLEHNIWEEDA